MKTLKQDELQNLQIYACKVVSRINREFFELENGQIASDSFCVDIQSGQVRIYDGISDDVYCTDSDQIDSWAEEMHEVFGHNFV